MVSRFPGMDPYLEALGLWPDFRARFVNCWCEALAEQLPEHYEARIDERVDLIEMPEDRARRIGPDVAVLEQIGAVRQIAKASGALTLEPIRIPNIIEEEVRQTYIEVLHRPGRRLVAVLELLSPSNKQEPGRELYLAKRNSLMHQNVHLVELDLLLKGKRIPLGKPLPVGNYFAFVSRGDRRPECEVYACESRNPLPMLPIPLSPPDPDAMIDLGEVFRTTYSRGRYERSIDYDQPPAWSAAPGVEAL